MSWSQEQVKMLIELYKEHPCLYAVKSVEYKNKHARNSALEKMYSELKLIRPSVSIAEIKSKFNNIRTNFLSEHRKYVNSLKSGMGTDEIYKPNIWYYEQMQFILEHSIPRQSVDSIMSPLASPITTESSENSREDLLIYSQSQDIIDNYETGTLNEEELQFITEATDFQQTQSTQKINIIKVDNIPPVVDYQLVQSTSAAVNPKVTPVKNVAPNIVINNKQKRKRSDNIEDETIKNANKVLKEISTAITAPVTATHQEKLKTRSESEIFGEFIIKQLTAIEEDEELFLDTQHIINNVLHDARKKIIAKRNT